MMPLLGRAMSKFVSIQRLRPAQKSQTQGFLQRLIRSVVSDSRPIGRPGDRVRFARDSGALLMNHRQIGDSIRRCLWVVCVSYQWITTSGDFLSFLWLGFLGAHPAA
jgi:hypothetical protein